MSNSNLIWGLILVIVGLVFLADNLGWADISLWRLIRDWWPLLVIWAGIDMLIKAFKRYKDKISAPYNSLG